MAKAPPLLPDETLYRVLRHARSNGMAVLSVGSIFALMGAMGGETIPVMVWLLVAGTGAMALHGATLLTGGESRGVHWLVGSQLFCMAFILSFCAWQFTHVDLTTLRTALTSERRTSIEQTGLTEDEFLLLTYHCTWGFIALVTFFYQGSMAMFYHRRRHAVITALATE